MDLRHQILFFFVEFHDLQVIVVRFCGLNDQVIVYGFEILQFGLQRLDFLLALGVRLLQLLILLFGLILQDLKLFASNCCVKKLLIFQFHRTIKLIYFLLKRIDDLHLHIELLLEAVQLSCHFLSSLISQRLVEQAAKANGLLNVIFQISFEFLDAGHFDVLFQNVKFRFSLR